MFLSVQLPSHPSSHNIPPIDGLPSSATEHTDTLIRRRLAHNLRATLTAGRKCRTDEDGDAVCYVIRYPPRTH